LLAAGNAELYRRDDVVCRPVTGLSPSQLAVLWRAGDDRTAIRVFSGIFCQCVHAGDWSSLRARQPGSQVDEVAADGRAGSELPVVGR
jgi:hypothetical protein